MMSAHYPISMPRFSLRAFLATLAVLVLVIKGIWFSMSTTNLFTVPVLLDSEQLKDGSLVENVYNSTIVLNEGYIEIPIVQGAAKEGSNVSTDSGSKYRLDRPKNHTSFNNTVEKSWIQQYVTTNCACQKFRVFKKLRIQAGLNKTIIFIHVPKTGGTTLEHLMKLPKGSCHANWSQYEACDGVAYRDALTFATVRHPVARAVSMYRYGLQWGNGKPMDKKKYAWVQGLDFSSFVEALPEYIEVVNFHPQVKFLTDDQGVLKVNRILCTESLGEDWHEMQKDLPRNKFGNLTAGNHLRSSIIPSNFTVNIDTEAKLKILYDQDFRLWEQHCNNTI
jgi:hypothetical protein